MTSFYQQYHTKGVFSIDIVLLSNMPMLTHTTVI